MKYAAFGNSGIRVSRIGFGAMGLNCAFGTFAESELIRAVHFSLERGVNFIDTARAYADSERILGRALRQWKGDRPFVATKAASRASRTNTGWGIPNSLAVAYPRGSVTRSVETSLRTLGLPVIDLVQLHQYWAQYEGGWRYDELLRMKEQGKIRFIGVSLTDHRHDQGISIVRNGLIDSVQTIVNIFDPLALDSLVPFCRERQVALIARCVLDEGGLTGAVNGRTTFDESDLRHGYFSRGPLREYVRRVGELRKFVPETAETLTELAIRFALHDPGVTVANISMHVPKFADQNIMASGKPKLPEAVFGELRTRHRWLVNLYEGKYFPAEAGSVEASGFRRNAGSRKAT